MAQNPLLGSRISLISKKNIRYEGTLYSINESDATVALQDVKSFGTEGREKMDEGCTFVPPQEAVHPYLLFRGCDIKDLHVHEKQGDQVNKKEPQQKQAPAEASSSSAKSEEKAPPAAQPSKDMSKKQSARRPRPKGKAAQVGTGASLLNRKERGTVDGGLETPTGDFDFQSNLANFEKEDGASSEEEPEENTGPTAYAKDDFFDSISCDTLDKQKGIDNRLRGSAERSLNTETFGAVALNSRRRRYGGRGRGRGRGRGGRGRGRGPRSQNYRWQKGSQQSSGNRQRNSGVSS